MTRTRRWQQYRKYLLGITGSSVPQRILLLCLFYQAAIPELFKFIACTFSDLKCLTWVLMQKSE
jgi:hypothetical protein